MPKIAYEKSKLRQDSLLIIEQANRIIAGYQNMGFDLTLRQLYYQFVSRGLLENSQKSYKRLGNIINKARLGGLVDWEAIVDRTRTLRGLSHWSNPEEIIRSALHSYHLDRWENQDYRPEVWIEKDALVGVISGVCARYDVPYFACRGYNSQSEQWRAAMRAKAHRRKGQRTVILHLGDHDPSGIDMSRDIEDRYTLTFGQSVIFVRLALKMSQVELYNPPPNPAKLTDSRVADYLDRFGSSSWELDALDPQVIEGLIEAAIGGYRDDSLWQEVEQKEERGKATLRLIEQRYDDIVEFLQGGE